MKLMCLFILSFSLFLVPESQGCPSNHSDPYNFEVNLDYNERSNEDNIKELEPNLRRNEEELVVTICEYNIRDEYYCYDLP